MLKKILIILTTLVSISSFASDGNDDLKAEFSSAYKKYQKYMGSGENSEAVEYAELSYDLGKKLYGKESENTAALALNYSLINSDQDESEDLALESIEIQEKLNGPSSLELVDALMQLSKVKIARLKESQGIALFRRVLSIVNTNDPDNTFFLANLNFEFGTNLYLHSPPKVSQKYFEEAKELYETLEGEEIIVQLAIVNFWIGKCQASRKQNRNAIESFSKSLDVFSLAPNSHWALTIHQFMARTYQKMGKKEEATSHFMAIGAAREKLGDEELLPLYTVQPEYPPNALRKNKEGWVLVSFTVDKEGYPINPVVEDSEGGDGFHGAAKKAALLLRFAPRFKDDEPVETKDVRYLYEFNIEE